jgi:hypothetical protein
VEHEKLDVWKHDIKLYVSYYYFKEYLLVLKFEKNKHGLNLFFVKHTKKNPKKMPHGYV